MVFKSVSIKKKISDYSVWTEFLSWYFDGLSVPSGLCSVDMNDVLYQRLANEKTRSQKTPRSHH